MMKYKELQEKSGASALTLPAPVSSHGGEELDKSKQEVNTNNTCNNNYNYTTNIIILSLS